MKAYYTVQEIAAEMGVSSQAVRDWIHRGEIIAIQAVENGVLRIPVPSYDAFKRRKGLSPRLPMRTPTGSGRSFGSMDEFYDARIAPMLRRDGQTADELVRQAADRVEEPEYRQWLRDYARYVENALAEVGVSHG